MDLTIATTAIYPLAVPNVDFTVNTDASGNQTYGTWTYTQTQPTQDQLNSAWLAYLKTTQIGKLTASYDAALKSGFSSSADGTARTYPLGESDAHEWMKAAIAVLCGSTINFDVKAVDGTIVALTPTQLKQFICDGATYGNNQLTNYRNKAVQVEGVQLANYTTAQDAFNAVTAVTY